MKTLPVIVIFLAVIAVCYAAYRPAGTASVRRVGIAAVTERHRGAIATQVWQQAGPLTVSRHDLERFVKVAGDIITRRNSVLFLIAAAALLLIAWLSDTRAFSFLSTLEHELMHGVTAVLCGGRLNAITVTAHHGGQAEVTGSFVVRLAPYCLPLFCLVCICIIPFLQHQARTVGILLAGLAYGNYLRGNFPNLGIQPDIRQSGGKLVSYPVILCSNACVLPGILMLLAKY